MMDHPDTPPAILPPECKAPWWAYALCIAVGLSLAAFLFYAGGMGDWFAVAFYGTCATYAPWGILRWKVDGQEWAEIVDFSTQSWAMLLIGMPIVSMVVASRGWLQLPQDSLTAFWHGWIWRICSYAAGVAFYLLRRWKLDHPEYKKAGAAVLLYSPAKLAIDWVAYIVTTAGIVYLCIPVVASELWAHTPYPLITTVSFVSWLVIGGWHDATVGLEVWRLHTAFNWALRKAVTRTGT